MERWIVFVLASLAAHVAHADEGMWTYDNPAARCRQEYGAESPRLARAAAARHDPPVELHGLVRLARRADPHQPPLRGSLPRRELDGGAQTCMPTASWPRAANRRCAARAQDADVLMEMEDVTAKVKPPPRACRMRRPNDGAQEGADAARAGLRGSRAEGQRTGRLCESVTLYQGGQYFLYKYRRYNDVRLVLRAGGAPSRRSAATRTTSSSRAGASTWRCCAPTRTASRRRSPNHLQYQLGRPRRRTNWCSCRVTRAAPIGC